MDIIFYLYMTVFSVIGAELVLEILDFLHKLKSKDSAIDTLLYGILQVY